MSSSNRPLAAAALATMVGLTVTARAGAQAPAEAPDSAAAPQAIASAPAETAYLLLELGGKPLPVRVEQSRCHEDVVAGTLRLREDGRWRLETSVRETCGSRSKMEHDDEDGTYQAEGSTLRFLDDDGHRNRADWDFDGEIDLDDLDHGTLAEGGDLTVRLADGKTVLRFRREGA